MRLGYALSSREGALVEFEETYELPASLGPLAPSNDEAVARALLGLHLAAGTSYWKTRIPRELVVDDASISADDAQFWNAVYTLGLGEFFYRNQIDPTGRASFRESSGSDPPGPRNPRPHQARLARPPNCEGCRRAEAWRPPPAPADR